MKSRVLASIYAVCSGKSVFFVYLGGVLYKQRYPLRPVGRLESAFFGTINRRQQNR